MMQRDNWGSVARIGMFVVDSEAVAEAEWWAMMPAGVSVHAARVTARAPWARWNRDRSAVKLEPDLLRGAEQFAKMRLSVVVTGHSSSSFLGGNSWDAAVATRLAEVLGTDVAITTNGLDCVAAMRAASVKAPLLVLPPWFGPATIDAGVEYLGGHSVVPAATLSFDPGQKWRGVPTAEMYPRGLGFEQEVQPLYEQIIAACPASADGVLIAGTGFRCVAIIEALEQKLGRPVIGANPASLWHALRLAGVDANVKGYGRLLAEL